jgi:hypothetical protein
MGIYEIEETQLQVMQEHLKKSKYAWSEVNEIKGAEVSVEAETVEEKPLPVEEKKTPVVEEEKLPAVEKKALLAEEEKLPVVEKKAPLVEEENLTVIVREAPLVEKMPPVVNVLADTIGRKINTDIRKSLSLNDRFRFRRDLFQGDVNEMDYALAQLNTLQSLNEALEYLDEKYDIPWNSESGIALKDLLIRQFV